MEEKNTIRKFFITMSLTLRSSFNKLSSRVSLRIQAECGKMREKCGTRITPNTDSSYVVISLFMLF